LSIKITTKKEAPQMCSKTNTYQTTNPPAKRTITLPEEEFFTLYNILLIINHNLRPNEYLTSFCSDCCFVFDPKICEEQNFINALNTFRKIYLKEPKASKTKPEVSHE